MIGMEDGGLIGMYEEDCQIYHLCGQSGHGFPHESLIVEDREGAGGHYW